MPISYSTAQTAYAKVLLIALLLFSAASVAAPEGARRNSLVLDAPTVAHVPVVVKRVLRSSAPIPAPVIEGIIHSEESEIPLVAPSSTITEKIKNSWRQNILEKSPGDMLETYKLRKEDGKLFRDPKNFLKWFKYAKDVTHPDEPYRAMIQALSDNYKNTYDLAVALEEGRHIKGMKQIAEKLQGAQVDHWIFSLFDSKVVFKRLKLYETKSKDLFENKVFPQWVSFTKAKDPNGKKAGMGKVFGYLNNLYPNTLLEGLVVGAKLDNPTALALLGYQILLWRNRNISLNEIYKVLELETAKESLLYKDWFTEALSAYEDRQKLFNTRLMKMVTSEFGERHVESLLLGA